MSRRTSLAAALLTACLLIAGAAWAQSSSGTITGRVLDPTGQTVPGATLRLPKPILATCVLLRRRRPETFIHGPATRPLYPESSGLGLQAGREDRP